jgi:hypothetical protein
MLSLIIALARLAAHPAGESATAVNAPSVAAFDCEKRASGTPERGRVSSPDVGSRAGRTAATLAQPGTRTRLIEFAVDDKDFTRFLDRPKRPGYPYQTGVFRAIAYVTKCSEPSGPKDMFPYAEKSFSVGFAYGE